MCIFGPIFYIFEYECSLLRLKSCKMRLFVVIFKHCDTCHIRQLTFFLLVKKDVSILIPELSL